MRAVGRVVRDGWQRQRPEVSRTMAAGGVGGGWQQEASGMDGRGGRRCRGRMAAAAGGASNGGDGKDAG